MLRIINQIKNVVVASAFLGIAFSTVNSFANTPITICPGKSGYKESSSFVYCGPALCTANTDGKTATCNDCYLMKGENLGTTSCEYRAALVEKGIYTSSFSLKKVLLPGKVQQPVIVCDPENGADTTYADCLNAPCKITDSKTGLATCQCEVVHMNKGETFISQTRSCDLPDKCNAPQGTILNGAPTPLVLPLLHIVTQKTGQPISEFSCSSSLRYLVGNTKASK